MSKRADRREFLRLSSMGVAGLALGCGKDAAPDDSDPDTPEDTGTPSGDTGDSDETGETAETAETGRETATPSCEETVINGEGPYYREGAPSRSDFDLYEHEGTSLLLEGRVLDLDCSPIPGAEVDLWMADPEGRYDNESEDFRYRGVVTADAEGRWSLRSLLPGWYEDDGDYRPRHIHVKIRVGGRPRLTTQLYFEGDPYNETDGLWREALTVTLSEQSDGSMTGSFDFVVEP